MDENGDGIISYDEFARLLIRRDYPDENIDTIISPSMRRSGDLGGSMQILSGGIKATSLSPPFRAHVSSSPNLSPVSNRTGAVQHSPVASGKGPCFFMDAPTTPQREKALRQRHKLIQGLDEQVILASSQ